MVEDSPNTLSAEETASMDKLTEDEKAQLFQQIISSANEIRDIVNDLDQKINNQK